MKIVFIHGRSQEKKDPKELEKLWTDSLYEGMRLASLPEPRDVEIAFPYYGDILFKETENADREAFRELMDRGAEAASPPAEEVEFTQAILRDMAHAEGISDEDVAREAQGEALDRGILNWRGVLAMVRLLNRDPRIAAASIELFTRDVWHYLTKKGTRLLVNQVVEKTIPAEGPCIVVAHSLGTIVGYNLLMDRRNRNNILRFITLGSPLGIEAIYSRLPNDSPPRKAPEGVGGWFNARDPQDIVALHEIPGRSFAGSPSVKNYSEVVNRSENQHGIAEYLKDRAVAQAIHEAVRA